MGTYEFRRSERGDLLATRSEPQHPDTQGLFIHEHENGYGSTGEFADWELPSNAVGGFHFFEFINGADGEYYRVRIDEMNFEGETTDPPPLPVRHASWPGRSRREIRQELERRRQRRIDRAVDQERERRERLNRERVRRDLEAQWERELEAELISMYGTEEEAVRVAILQEFGDIAA